MTQRGQNFSFSTQHITAKVLAIDWELETTTVANTKNQTNTVAHDCHTQPTHHHSITFLPA